MHASRRLALLALTAAAASAGTAHAQVSIYGTLDLAVGQIETQPAGPPNARIVRVRSVHNGGLQTSYIGFRGTEDLGDGLKARFQLEGFLRGDTGQSGRFDANPGSAADFFWSREAFVALGGGFGEVRLGNNVNPTWVTMIQTNALGANSVFSPSFRQLFNGGTRGKSEVDTAMVNSIKYVSPVIAGVEASVVLQAGEGSGKFSYAANLGYRAGPILVSAAMQNIRHAAVPNLPGARDQSMVMLGGAYDFGVVRAFAQYTMIDNDRLNTEDKLPHLGFTAPLGANGVVQFSTGEDKTTNAAGATSAKRGTTSLGYVHSLSKRTDLYTFVMNEKIQVFGPPVIAFDGTGKSYVAGVRHRF